MSDVLTEIQLEGILVDEATGTGVLSGDGTLIQNCLLCGKESLNGYKFGSAAFGTTTDNKVQKLYDGKLVFIDHTESGKHPMARKVKEFAGKITSVRFDAEGRPRGDIETAFAPNGGLLRDLVKGGFKHIGLSHTAQYKFNRDKTVVESIENVFSVDVVVNPATTRSFRENVEQDTEGNKHTVTLEEAMSKLLETQTALKTSEEKTKVAEARVIEVETRLTTVKTELDTVSVELKTMKAAEEARESRDALLKDLTDKGINVADSDICPEHFISGLLATAGEVREGLINLKLAAIAAGKESAQKGAGATKERKEVTGSTKESFDVKKALDSEDIFC